MNYIKETLLAFASTENINEYFKRYVIDIKGVSEKSFNKYVGALRTISRYMKEMGLVQESIYELGSIEQLDFAWSMLNKNADFTALNERGNHMYSAGYNHYHSFAIGETFHTLTDREIIKMDTPVKCEKPVIMEYKIWKRSGILRTQTVELAGYQCDINHEHKTFIADSTKKQYMEAHHIIPLQHQEKFKNSLDVYANLISLCPICHRKIHLGVLDDRRVMVDELYEKRKERLVNCGFLLGKEEFEDIILSSEENKT